MSPTADSSIEPAAAASVDSSRRRRQWKLLAVVAICIAPVIASYLMYYVFPPTGRTNYGVLIDPQRPVPAAFPAPGDGSLKRFEGRWVLMTLGRDGCPKECVERLYFMRQTHAAMGRERERVAQVLVLLDGKPLDPQVMPAYPDLVVLRGDAQKARDFLAGGATKDSASSSTNAGTANPESIMHVIDPVQNLMMQFPENPDPARVRKDLQRLLKASRVG